MVNILRSGPSGPIETSIISIANIIINPSEVISEYFNVICPAQKLINSLLHVVARDAVGTLFEMQYRINTESSDPLNLGAGITLEWWFWSNPAGVFLVETIPIPGTNRIRIQVTNQGSEVINFNSSYYNTEYILPPL